MSKQFLRSLRKQIRRIRVRTIMLSHICGEVGLHNLRTDLKLLRARLRFLRNLYPEFPYHAVYKPYKKVFNRAGQVRFWQVMLKILEAEPGRNEDFALTYQVLLYARLLQTRAAFCEIAREEELPRWRDVKSAFRQSIRHFHRTVMDRYFSTLQQEAGQILNDPGHASLEERHTLRKILKEYSSNRKLVSKYFNYDPGPMPGVPTEAFALNDLIGRWHDIQVAGVQLAEDLGTQEWSAPIVDAGNILLQHWKKREHALWKEVSMILGE